MAYGSVLADVVQGSTSGTPPQFNDGNGTQIGTLCRAWVSFTSSGSTSIQASFNVSSVTYSSAGVYVINFTNSLPDANFVGTPVCTQGGTAYIAANGTRATGSLQVKTFSQAGSAADATSVQCGVFR